jgi:hypothetical protein
VIFTNPPVGHLEVYEGAGFDEIRRRLEHGRRP